MFHMETNARRGPRSYGTNNTEESVLYYLYKGSTTITSHSFTDFAVILDSLMNAGYMIFKPLQIGVSRVSVNGA